MRVSAVLVLMGIIRNQDYAILVILNALLALLLENVNLAMRTIILLINRVA